MFAIIIALILLCAGVAAIYLLLKSMSEEGVDIAAPGSCKRRRCGDACSPGKASEDTRPTEIETEPQK